MRSDFVGSLSGGFMKRRAAVLVIFVCSLTLAVMPEPVRASSHARPYDPVPAGWPRLVAIPRIHLRAAVESLALNRQADFKAPYRWDDVAWYDRGPRPGDMGRANMFGHLDSLCCPAAFYLLKDLQRGDQIDVAYRDGGVLHFRVQWQGTYWNAQLPTKLMFATTRERGLVLITCTGVFHRDGTGYDHKRVVYATMVWPRR
ncbi:MAG: hypothetical protein DLM70_06580 [Chloroflexi bacterium]|nr:MAG: hypothetical protein DLM70_06580 [Chloroflexota bacterium]